tara:strand:- start:175 stop:762 length:588 start_codon:yes stop_codon:yes gene_type:complete
MGNDLAVHNSPTFGGGRGLMGNGLAVHNYNNAMGTDLAVNKYDNFVPVLPVPEPEFSLPDYEPQDKYHFGRAALGAAAAGAGIGIPEWVRRNRNVSQNVYPYPMKDPLEKFGDSRKRINSATRKKIGKRRRGRPRLTIQEKIENCEIRGNSSEYCEKKFHPNLHRKKKSTREGSRKGSRRKGSRKGSRRKGSSRK